MSSQKFNSIGAACGIISLLVLIIVTINDFSAGEHSHDPRYSEYLGEYLQDTYNAHKSKQVLKEETRDLKEGGFWERAEEIHSKMLADSHCDYSERFPGTTCAVVHPPPPRESVIEIARSLRETGSYHGYH